MMQYDMRISENIMPILNLKSTMHFYANIINKYRLREKLHRFTRLDYLLPNKSSTLYRINQPFHLNLQLSIKPADYWFKSATVFNPRYRNNLTIQEHHEDNRRFHYHNHNHIKRKDVLKESKRFSYQEKIQMMYFHQKRDVLNRHYFKNDTFNDNVGLFYLSMHREKLSISNRDITIHNKQALLQKEKAIQQIRLKKEHNDTSSNQMHIKREKNSMPVWNITHHNQINLSKLEGTKRSIVNHHINLPQQILPHKYGLIRDIQNHNHRERALQPIVYKKETQQQPMLMYAVDKSIQLSQALSEQIKQITQTQVKEHFESQPISTEQILTQVNHYDIKKVANSVYPMIMKRWQKEYERRGVFYG